MPHASPSVRQYARNLSVDLRRVKGDAPNGHILQSDVLDFVKGLVDGEGGCAAPPPVAGTGIGIDLLPWPSLDFSKFGLTDKLPLPRIKKISGPNLHRNWVMIPHVTQYVEADVTDLEQFRQDANAAVAKTGVKLTMLASLQRPPLPRSSASHPLIPHLMPRARI